MSFTTRDSLRHAVYEKLLAIGDCYNAIRQFKTSESDDVKEVAALELVKKYFSDQIEALVSAVPPVRDQTNCSKTMEFNSSPPEKNFVKEQPFAEVEHRSPEKQPITTANEDETGSYNDETDSYDEHGYEDDDMVANDHDCEKCCFTLDDGWDALDEKYLYNFKDARDSSQKY